MESMFTRQWVSGAALIAMLAGCSSNAPNSGQTDGGGAGQSQAGTGGTSSTSPALGNPIMAGTCTNAYSACGGDPKGTWKSTDICVEGDFVQAYNDYEEQEYGSACKDLIRSVTVGLSSVTTYGEGVFTANAASVLEMERVYTSACLSSMSGSTVTMTVGMCASLQTSFSQQVDTTATCAFDGTACTCATKMTSTSTYSDAYSVSGNSLVWTDGSTTEFCIDGNSMLDRHMTDFDGVLYVVTSSRQ
jgi:hypothetical protein